MRSNSVQIADPAEELRLEQAIAKADQILVASLKHDEKRRLRRFTLVGGIIMLAIAATIVALLLGGEVSAADKQASKALNAAGWQAFQKRDLSEAEAKFNDAVTKDPNNAAAWNGLGWARLNQAKRDEAEQAFVKCAEVDPKNAAAAYNGLGWINFGRQKYDDAEKAWLKSNGIAAWNGLAQLYLLQSKWDDALKYANKSLQAGEKTAKEFADAAKAKHLSEELRQKIVPSGDANAAAPAADNPPANDAANVSAAWWELWI
jgi:tetratricopeptide (TPR) repeat protein